MPRHVDWTADKVTQTAEALVEMRLRGKPRDTYPGDVPPDLNTAYAVQSSAVRQWPDQLVGFKVGGIPHHFRAQFPAEWLAGPVFAKNVFHIQMDEILDFPIYKDGFAAFEPELIFVIESQSIVQHQDWDVDSVSATIKQIYVGAEIAASPNINVNKLGPGSIISDFGNNGGIVIGQELSVSQLEVALGTMVDTQIDGLEVGRNKPSSFPSGPLGALKFLLEHLGSNQTLYDLPKEFYISSGAITGVHKSDYGALGALSYESLQTLNIRLS